MESHSEMTLSIGEAAKQLGVSTKTLRRWADAGKIRYQRSPTGQRRFYLKDIKHITPRNPQPLTHRLTINYARVSSDERQKDLKSQIQLLENFSAANGWQYETISDFGGGLNYHKKGLNKLLRKIMTGDVERLVMTHKDRLLRFGAELIFTICEEFGTEVVIINKSPEGVSFEDELTQDMMELITVFSARLYGARSQKNQKLLDGMSKVVKELE